MDKQKEIKEMAKIINKRVDTNLGQIHGTKSGFGNRADVTTTVSTKLVAEALVNAGYGDVKQAVREFAERLKERVNLKPVACGYWDKESIGWEIDELVKEVCGE